MCADERSIFLSLLTDIVWYCLSGLIMFEMRRDRVKAEELEAANVPRLYPFRTVVPLSDFLDVRVRHGSHPATWQSRPH
jgi:hypothetical protein